MATCEECISTCDQFVPYRSASDFECFFDNEMAALRPHHSRETDVLSKGLLGFIGRKTERRSSYNSRGYLRTWASLANRMSFQIAYAGLHAACEHDDMEILQRSLGQSARISALFAELFESEEDHCRMFDSAIGALAAADQNLLEKTLPYALGLSKTGAPKGVACTNLLIGLWHSDDEALSTGVAQAEAWLQGKQKHSEAGEVRYLLALAHNNAADASAALSELCRGLSLEREPYSSPAAKALKHCMSQQVHGLYNLAVFVKGKDFADRLSLFEGYLFQPYIEYLKAHSFSCAEGQHFIFKGESQLINAMVDAIPITTIKQISAKAQEIDTVAFADDLLASVQAKIGDMEQFFRRYNP